MARRGYHRHRLSQRVLPHIRDVPRLLSFAGALAGVGLAAAPAPSPPLLLYRHTRGGRKVGGRRGGTRQDQAPHGEVPSGWWQQALCGPGRGNSCPKTGRGRERGTALPGRPGVYRTTGWRNALRRSLGLALVDPFRLPLVNIAGVAFRDLPRYIVS